MNVQTPYNRSISRWSRVLAGMLTALLTWVTVELAWSVVHGGTPPGLLAKTLLFLAIAGSALALCGFIALTGHAPQWWSRFEGPASNAPGSPLWRRSWPRRPRWLKRASLAGLACIAVGNAAVITVALSNVAHTPKTFFTLALVWCLALGVLCATILSWRAAAQMPTPDD
jgi:hypothetical protein